MTNRSTQPKKTARIDPRWLEGKTKGELIDMMLEITLELKSRLSKETTQATALIATVPSAFPVIEPDKVPAYTRLPTNSTRDPDAPGTSLWALLLLSANPDSKPLALEIYDDVIVGRGAEGVHLDLDLTPYGAEQLGVSREHALLRPTPEGLELFDLGSANGTFCNGSRGRLGTPLHIADGDVITFGGLHLKLKVVRAPGRGN